MILLSNRFSVFNSVQSLRLDIPIHLPLYKECNHMEEIRVSHVSGIQYLLLLKEQGATIAYTR